MLYVGIYLYLIILLLTSLNGINKIKNILHIVRNTDIVTYKLNKAMGPMQVKNYIFLTWITEKDLQNCGSQVFRTRTRINPIHDSPHYT